MFGFSFGEMLMIGLVTLVVVGPQRLPSMLKTMGGWARKLRKMTMDVRQQTGIDEMLRAEGIQLSELRTLMRGYHGGAAAPAAAAAPARPAYEDPYANIDPDPLREYPPEGADAYGALPDDLLESAEAKPAEPAALEAPSAAPSTVAAPPPVTDPVPPPVTDPVPPPVTDPVPPPVTDPVPPPVAVAAPVPVPAPAPSAIPPRPAVTTPPRPATAPPPAPVRSVAPPAPSSRPAVAPPRPPGTPPPPPRRTVPPPTGAKPEIGSAPAAAPTGQGNNGNG